MCLLRSACHYAGHLRAGLLGAFLSRNIFRAKFSTRVHAGASFKEADKSHIAVPSAVTEARPVWEMNPVQLEAIQELHAPAHRRCERGEGKLKTVITLAIIVLAIYSAVKIVPIYVSEYQLSDKMQEQARFAVVNRYTEDQIRDNILKVIQDLDIPAKRESIKVVSTNSIVRISLEYTVPVDLLFYHMDLHFSPSSENKALI